MPSTTAVEGTLNECVVEYSAVIDHFLQSAEFGEKLASYATTTDEEVEYSQELYAAVARSAPELTKVADKEFESVANLALYILSLGDSAQTLQAQFVKELISQHDLQDKVVKNKKKTIRVLSLVSVLSTVFNSTESEQLKKIILSEILSLVNILDDSVLLKQFASNVESILLSSPVDETTRELVLKTSQLIASQDALESLRLQQLAITMIPSPTQQLVDSYIVNSLNTPSALDLSEIVQLESITSLASKQLIDYTNAYLYTASKEFSTQQHPVNVQVDAVLKKNQYLTLLKLGLTNDTLSYATIASELLIQESEVELILIDAIKLKIIEGKISQLDQVFHVYRVGLIVKKKIDQQDWTHIKQTLTGYKKSLQEVRQLIDQAQKKRKN
jgi:hypothetical protein